MMILAFWTAGQFFVEKAYVLLVFAGILGADAGRDRHHARVHGSPAEQERVRAEPAVSPSLTRVRGREGRRDFMWPRPWTSSATAYCCPCGPAEPDLDLDAVTVRLALALQAYLRGDRDPDLLVSGPQFERPTGGESVGDVRQALGGLARRGAPRA